MAIWKPSKESVPMSGRPVIGIFKDHDIKVCCFEDDKWWVADGFVSGESPDGTPTYSSWVSAHSDTEPVAWMNHPLSKKTENPRDFDLDEYLDTPKRVVTRTGKPVEILKTNLRNPQASIVGVINWEDGNEDVLVWPKSGRISKDSTADYDLMFADGGDTADADLKEEVASLMRADGKEPNPIDIRCETDKLLDLAEKALGKTSDKSDCLRWRKMPDGICGNGDRKAIYLVRTSWGNYITTSCLCRDKDSLYIPLEDLENLPKEGGTR